MATSRSNEALFRLAHEVVAEASHHEQDGSFWLIRPTVQETPEGPVLTAYPNRHLRVEFTPTGTRAFLELIGRLESDDRVAKRYDHVDLMRLVGEDLVRISLQPDQPVSPAFARTLETLRTTVPTLTIFPLTNVRVGSRPRTFGGITIGQVWGPLEQELDRQVRGKGLHSFAFADDVPWTGGWCAVKADQGLVLDKEFASQKTVVAAVWDSAYGRRATQNSLASLEFLFAAWDYLVQERGLHMFGRPGVVGRDVAYGDERINHDHDEEDEFRYYYETEWLQLRSLQRHPDPIHALRIEAPLDLKQLLSRRTDIEFIQTAMATLDERVSDVMARFGRHVQWCYAATGAASVSTSVVAYATALEALLGGQAGSGGLPPPPITATIADRVALLLPARTLEDRERNADRTREFYGHRNRAVHGGALRATDPYAVRRAASELVRSVGRHYLRAARRWKWTRYEDMDRWFRRQKYA